MPVLADELILAQHRNSGSFEPPLGLGVGFFGVAMSDLKCNHCKEYFPKSEFTKNKSMKSGYCHYCKPCMKKAKSKYRSKPETKAKEEVYRAKYYAENQERLAKSARAFYWENRESLLKGKGERRLANLEEARAKDRERWHANRDENLAKQKAWVEANPEKLAAAKKRYYDANLEKFRAHSAITKAVKNGDLARQPCEVCGEGKAVEAHHDDYNKPLDVRWLCRKHHTEHHSNERLKGRKT